MEWLEELTMINNAYHLHLKENDQGFQYVLYDKEKICEGTFFWSDLEESLIKDPLAAARYYAITDIGIVADTVVKESLCEFETDDLAHRLEEFGYEYDSFGYGDKVTLGTDARGNLIRLDNTLANIPVRLEEMKTKLVSLENQQEAARAESGKPFPQEKELAEKSARLVELDAELNMDERKSPKQREERSSVLAELKHLTNQIPQGRPKAECEVVL